MITGMKDLIVTVERTPALRKLKLTVKDGKHTLLHKTFDFGGQIMTEPLIESDETYDGIVRNVNFNICVEGNVSGILEVSISPNTVDDTSKYFVFLTQRTYTTSTVKVGK